MTLASVRGVYNRVLAGMLLLSGVNWASGAWAQMAVHPAWWRVACLGLLGAACSYALACAVVGSPSPWPARLVVAATVLPLATWGMGDSAQALEGPPWVWGLLPTAVGAAAVAFGPLPGLAAGLAMSGGWGFLRAATDGVPGQLTPLADVGYLVAFTVGIALPVAATTAVARRVDLAAAAATRASAQRARAAEALRERTRLDALVHDTVLAALSVAARDMSPPAGPAGPAGHNVAPTSEAGPTREVAAQQARAALAALDAAHDGEMPVTTSDLLARLHEAAEVAARAPVRVELHGDGKGDGEGRADADVDVDARVWPGDVAAGLVQAAAEMVRNAVRHGGADGSRPGVRLLLRTSADGLQLTICDDGPGFSPAEVAPDRLGLRLSVHDRLQRVGGEATVTSRPGAGTTATLRWPSPQVPAGRGR